MESVKIGHVAKEIRVTFGIGRKDLLSKFEIVVNLRILAAGPSSSSQLLNSWGFE
jgi:hypothetical protein